MTYANALQPIGNLLPILADYPQYVEPLQHEQRFLAPPVVADENGKLLVRSWRYWYNARGIVEMENRLDSRATAIVMVHPWGIDDGHGLRTPEPAGVAFQCAVKKNLFVLEHIRDVVNPFLARLRDEVGMVGFSLPGKEDDIRRLMYASVLTPPEKLNVAKGERLMADLIRSWTWKGQPLIAELRLDREHLLQSYFAQTPSTDAGDRYNGAGFWDLPMPASNVLERGPKDRAFYDAEGYAKVRDYLQRLNVRHILLIGYCTDMCVKATTCGYNNFSQDFNVFIVGDATMATFPGSTTPKYATQVALANAALTQMVTQVNWVRMEAVR